MSDLNELETEHIALGDDLQATGLQLKREQPDGTFAVVDVTSLTVKLVVEKRDGTRVLTDDTDSLTITDAANGKVSIDWPTAVAGTAGTYYYWLRVFNGAERETFPPDGKKRMLIVSDAPGADPA